MSLLRLREVCKQYDKIPVLRGVYFRRAAKDCVGLIGKNGTGKITILRLILNRDWSPTPQPPAQKTCHNHPMRTLYR